MIQQRLGRNVKDVPLKVLQVMDAQQLLARFRVTDYEVTESEVLHYGISQVDREFLGILGNESAAEFLYQRGVFLLRRFHYYGQIRVTLTQIFGELDTGL